MDGTNASIDSFKLNDYCIHRFKSDPSRRCPRKTKNGIYCGRHMPKSGLQQRSIRKDKAPQSVKDKGKEPLEHNDYKMEDELLVPIISDEEVNGEVNQGESQAIGMDDGDLDNNDSTIDGGSTISRGSRVNKVVRRRSRDDEVKRFVFDCIDEYLERHQRRVTVLGAQPTTEKKSGFGIESILGVAAMSALPILAKKFLSNDIASTLTNSNATHHDGTTIQSGFGVNTESQVPRCELARASQHASARGDDSIKQGPSSTSTSSTTEVSKDKDPTNIQPLRVTKS